MTNTILTGRHALTVAKYGNDLRIAYRLLLTEGHVAVAHVLTEVPFVEKDYGTPLGVSCNDGDWTVRHVRRLADKALLLLEELELQAEYDRILRLNLQEETHAEVAARSLGSARKYVEDVCAEAQDVPAAELFVRDARRALADAAAISEDFTVSNAAYLAAQSATWNAGCAMRIARRARHEEIRRKLYPTTPKSTGN